jgi:hypothetical protein
VEEEWITAPDNCPKLDLTSIIRYAIIVQLKKAISNAYAEKKIPAEQKKACENPWFSQAHEDKGRPQRLESSPRQRPEEINGFQRKTR